MKRIFKNKISACLIAAVIALLAAAFACFSLNKRDAITAEAASTPTATIYWRLSSDKKTLEISSSNLTGGSARGSISGNKTWNSDINASDREQITKVDVKTAIVPVQLSNWFNGFTNLTDISTLSLIDTSLCANFSNLFNNCKALSSLEPLRDWDVSNVDQFINAFCGCESIESVEPLADWDVSNATGIGNMFRDCKSLTSLEPVYGWNITSKCIDFSCFVSGTAITSADFTSWDWSNAQYVDGLFSSCHSLQSVKVNNMVTEKAKSLVTVFSDCTVLETIEGLETWDTSGVTNMAALFNTVPAIASLDLSNFNTSKVTSFGTMFIACDSLESLDISSFEISSTANVANMLHVMNGIKKLVISDSLAARIGDTNLFTTNPTWYNATGTETYTASSPMTTGGTYFTEMPVCTHNWVKNDGNSTAATCTDGGTDFFDCSLCGETKTEPTSASGHTYGAWVDKTAATCTADKIQEKTCSKCGDKQTQTVTGTMLGHSYGTPDWEWSADFSTATAKFTCTRSGCSYTHSLPATVTQTPTAATCTAKGKITYNATLAVTGAEFTQSTYTDSREKEVAQLEHVAATTWSKDADNHWHACTLSCGTQLDKAAHAYTIWKVDTAATVTSTGVGHYECVCGERGTDVEIPVETCAHPNKTHHAAVAATCVAAGNPEYWTCNDCNKNLDSSNAEIATTVIPVDPDNHVAWGVWQTETAATCVATGTEKRVCANCNHEETREIAIDPNAHDLEHNDGQASTCTETGWGEYDTCTRCDYTTYSEIAALGHDYQTAEGGVAPTCTEEGSGKLVCTRCNDEKEGDSIPALGHTEVTDEAKSPTCTETGLTAGTHCSVCSEVLTAQEEVPALGHNYEWVITKEATTEEAGLMENKCTVCGHKDGEQEIAKLIDPNGEIDLPIDVHVEFKVTQSSTGNNYSDIDKGLKQGYWAQLWYRNDDGTLGDEFTDQINCFLTLKIPTDIIEAIRGGEEINRDKIAAGLKVFYIDGDGLPVEVENFTIAMRDDDSWQIKFNYNEKFRAEVVFAADLTEQPTPEPEQAGIPWWVWLIVGLVVVAIVGVVIIIIVVAKKKNDDNTPTDNGELLSRMDSQDQILNELLNRGDDGGFNTPVELDENGNVIFK